MIFFFSETNAKYTLYKKETSKYHYLKQDSSDPSISIYLIQWLYDNIPTPEYIEAVDKDVESGTYSLNDLIFGEYRYGYLTSTSDYGLFNP